MRLEYIDGDDRHNQRTILHEFGHALGFEHEHSSPEAGIQWNTDAVIAHYKNWSVEEIEHNILQVADDASIRSRYDLESIMGYQLSQSLVTSGMVSIKKFTNLSPLDKEWARKFYPFSNRPERSDHHVQRSRDATEALGSQARQYKDHFIYRANKKLDDCFRESGMKVFRCGKPNCRPKDRQCDACLERHDSFQNGGMDMISHHDFLDILIC
ncbi:uncharacterized protein F4807DRAFT_404627 [Annulohypoxylon truncatum]|uniref:uncharacterized protein n=1 Tax=Annulohypoxylon truncatum TaxID=327061 RepID=UPI0020079308|nr:uncharacterized protein F4807DRAFT_404627 [Annulohypoxylon truncatum]KAI1214807.1 hypothetical protein F4807DRAFT_404627 [Annulohypoxylon truncatum]